MLLEILVPLFLPPVNDEFEDACAWQAADVPCASIILPSGYDVTLSVPGATFSISDFDGAPSRTDVTFSQTITITDELLVPGAGVVTYTPVCLDTANNPMSLAGGRSIQIWADGEPGFQALGDWVGDGPGAFTIGVSEVCAPSQSRGILAYATWADNMWAPGFDVVAGGTYQYGWDPGNSRPEFPELWFELVPPEADATWTVWAYFDGCQQHVGNSVNLQSCLNSESVGSVTRQWVNNDDSTTGVGTVNLQNYSGWELHGGVLRRGVYGNQTWAPTDKGFRIIHLRGGVNYTMTFYKWGSDESPDPGAYGGLGAASITRSDALDSVRFVPDPIRSNLLTIDGMCSEWDDCASMCTGYGLDVTGWLSCFFGFGDLDLGEVWSALMTDFMESPLIAQVRVAYANIERALVAIERVSDTCGVLGQIDTGMIGSISLDTCSIPSDFRSNVRLAGAFMVAVAGCFLVARNLMIGLGMPFIGYGGGGEEAAPRQSVGQYFGFKR